MHLKGIIYDFDGTLLDSGKEKSLPRLEKVIRSFGYSLDADMHERMSRAWGQSGVPFIADILGVNERTARVIYDTWEGMDAHEPHDFIESAIETVEFLHAKGLVSCLVTSRARESLVAIAVRAPIFDEFACITSADDTPHHKPDPRAFNAAFLALKRRGVERHETILVGDTAQDIRAGSAAGLRTVVVETGPYRDGQQEEHPVPEHDVIPSVAHLPRWIGMHCRSPILSEKEVANVT
ncbi:MAG: pyrophosphatase PpaX [Parcubacteria bacterium C7867-001]|nr:MAG: pyrophosphatase PpaX [Parcubacteria bacterium C7867-001]